VEPALFAFLQCHAVLLTRHELTLVARGTNDGSWPISALATLEGRRAASDNKGDFQNR
jgi:hypothetical protein